MVVVLVTHPWFYLESIKRLHQIVLRYSVYYDCFLWTPSQNCQIFYIEFTTRYLAIADSVSD